MTTVNDRQTPTNDMVRPRDDRVVAGVSAALANRLGVGVGWVRIAFVALTPFGGVGVLAYLLGWLLIREEGRSETILESWFSDGGNATMWIGVGLIGLAVVTVLGATNFVRGDMVFAAALFVAGLMLFQGKLPTTRRTDPPPPVHPDPVAGPPSPTTTVPVTAAATTEHDVPGSAGSVSALVGDDVHDVIDTQEYQPATFATDGGLPEDPVSTTTFEQPQPRKPVEPPSPLGRLVFASILLAVGSMAVVDLAGGVDLSAHHYLATAVGLTGAGLLVGAFVGRARGLIFLGIILLPALVVSSLVRVDLFGEWGEFVEQPRNRVEAESGFEISGGQLVLDLTTLELVAGDDPVVVEASVGIGEMRVYVPEGVEVDLTANVGAGRLLVDDDGRLRETTGFGLERDVVSDASPQILIDVEVGIGNLETAVQ